MYYNGGGGCTPSALLVAVKSVHCRHNYLHQLQASALEFGSSRLIFTPAHIRRRQPPCRDRRAIAPMCNRRRNIDGGASFQI